MEDSVIVIPLLTEQHEVVAGFGYHVRVELHVEIPKRGNQTDVGLLFYFLVDNLGSRCYRLYYVVISGNSCVSPFFISFHDI